MGNYEMQRVERGKEDKDNVVLYFDSWPRQEQCITLPLKQDTIINEAKPAVVSLYDYYNTEDKATVLYRLEGRKEYIFHVTSHDVKIQEKKEQTCIVKNNSTYEME